MQSRPFKIHCSQISKIMGRIGLTDLQIVEMETLSKKEKRTPLQEEKVHDLIKRFNYPELPDTAKSFLKIWYANEHEEIHSKEIDKGNEVEKDLIDFMAIQLGYGMAEKNEVILHDEYMVGTCDVEFPDCIVDVKAPYNKKTLHDSVMEFNKDYEPQLQGYMHLWKKKSAILFYGLMNTPETDWRAEVIYDNMPDHERWVAYKFEYNEAFIKSVQERVLMCRAWLEKYDIDLKSKLGRVN